MRIGRVQDSSFSSSTTTMPRQQQVSQQRPGYLGRQRVVKIGKPMYTPEEDRQRDKDRMQKGNNNNGHKMHPVVYMPKPKDIHIPRSKRACQEKIPRVNNHAKNDRSKEMNEMRRETARIQQNMELDSHRTFPLTPEGCMMRMRRLKNRLHTVRNKNGIPSKIRRSEISRLRYLITELHPTYEMCREIERQSKENRKKADEEEKVFNPFNW